MAISKQSEEEVIRLGKRIVKELKLDKSVNTLGRWMAHYVAELINNAENSTSEDEKSAYRKECCELILKLWINREHIPNISKPLSDLEPLIEVLDNLKKEDHSYPFWRHFDNIPDNPTWKGFVNTVKTNSEDIFELCLYSLITKDLLEKKQEWIKSHKSMLSEEELELIDHLTDIVTRNQKQFVVLTDESQGVDILDLTTEERYILIIKKIESKLEEQRNELHDLKTKLIIDLHS